jgi:hypothetical protein
MKLPLQISCLQANTLPSAPQSAEIRTTPEAPSGDQLKSSARDHTTCTGRPRYRDSEHRSVHRRVVGAIVAVAARAFDVPDHDTVLRNLQRACDLTAQRVHPLAVRPDL